MGEEIESERIKKICELIQERDMNILEMDVQINYYKDSIKEKDRQITQMEKAKKKILDHNKELDEQLEQLVFVQKSIEQGNEMAIEALLNCQSSETMAKHFLKLKQQDAEKVKEEFDNIYTEAKRKITENPLYKELEMARADFLKVDIQLRQLQLEIRIKKRMNATKRKIDKQLFQNFCIRLARHCLIEQKREDLKRLQAEEQEAVKNLVLFQEEKKMREKMGKSHKLKDMSNLFFGTGSQETRAEIVVNKTEPVSPQKISIPQVATTKVLSLLQQEEPTQPIEIVPSKIRIIDQKVVVPAFTPAPELREFERRKVRAIDWTKKWQGMFKKNNEKQRCLNTSGSFEQPSPKSCQSTQSSQLSQQSSQRTQESQCQSEYKLMDSSMDNNIAIQTGLPIMPSFKEPLPVEYPPMQHQIMETVNRDEKLMMTEEDNSQSSKPPSFGSPSIAVSESQVNPRSILSTSKDTVNKTDKYGFGEQTKSVRFNLDSSPASNNMQFGEQKSVRFNFEKPEQPKEPSGGMFGNAFGSFLGQSSALQFNLNDNNPEQSANLNDSFNISMQDGNSVLEFNSDNENNQDFSYVMSGDEQPFNAPGGGGGGFFSFGSKSMFSFK